MQFATPRSYMADRYLRVPYIWVTALPAHACTSYSDSSFSFLWGLRRLTTHRTTEAEFLATAEMFLTFNTSTLRPKATDTLRVAIMKPQNETENPYQFSAQAYNMWSFSPTVLSGLHDVVHKAER
jgi:hypothetical protein